MKYDFDQMCNRKGTGSVKWDSLRSVFGHEDVIPMWIADMDFPAPQPVVQALVDRAKHPCYGYSQPGSDLINVIAERMQTQTQLGDRSRLDCFHSRYYSSSSCCNKISHPSRKPGHCSGTRILSLF